VPHGGAGGGLSIFLWGIISANVALRLGRLYFGILLFMREGRCGAVGTIVTHPRHLDGSFRKGLHHVGSVKAEKVPVCEGALRASLLRLGDGDNFIPPFRKPKSLPILAAHLLPLVALRTRPVAALPDSFRDDAARSTSQNEPEGKGMIVGEWCEALLDPPNACVIVQEMKLHAG
jgi:hypothetical protein